MKTITKQAFINKMNEIAREQIIPVIFISKKYEVEEVSEDLIDTFPRGRF